jgi:hypothetical protein
MPALSRTNQKITFAEMRSAGVRGILVYAQITSAAIGPALTPIGGLTTSGYRTSSRCSPARLAANGAPTSARISIGRKRPDARRKKDGVI